MIALAKAARIVDRYTGYRDILAGPPVDGPGICHEEVYHAVNEPVYSQVHFGINIEVGETIARNTKPRSAAN